eukprot:PhM_4_TR2078/c0_g1_i1/m.47598
MLDYHDCERRDLEAAIHRIEQELERCDSELLLLLHSSSSRDDSEDKCVHLHRRRDMLVQHLSQQKSKLAQTLSIIKKGNNNNLELIRCVTCNVGEAVLAELIRLSSQSRERCLRV